MSGLLILGAGGHAKVILDILNLQGVSVQGFLDDDETLWGQTRLGLSVLGGISTYGDYAPDGLILGIGSNAVRRILVEALGAEVAPLWRSAVHPQAVIAESVQAGIGTVVMAGAVINVDTVIGSHCIINTGASVDHDCQLGDYVHIAPGVRLSGGVLVGDDSMLGIGSVVIPGVTIGRGVMVGAGAVVVRDVPNGVTAKGVPARW